MNMPATLPETPADWARAMVERQLQMLGRLAEAGLEIAVALEAQAKGGPVVVEGDIAMAYARVARAVRQAILLQSKLIEGLRDREQAAAGRKSARRASAARIIRDVIDDERANDSERTEQLRAEAAERLEHEDFADLDVRPFGAVVMEICRDLGLSPDWLALARDCAAAEAAFSGEPGAPPGNAEDGDVQLLWIDPDSPPGETRYYDPAERREQRRLRDSS
jgi:hypothetical protein